MAWLRRIGMPLARIRAVCDLAETDASAAARQVRAYWAGVEAETAARRDLSEDGREGIARPDLRLHEAKPGDRYLLCSDGLFAAVPHGDIRRAVESAGDPDDAVTGLIALAHGAGAPDNVACVVADVVEEAVPA